MPDPVRWLLLALLLPAQVQAQSWDDIAPILEERCVLCHSGPDAPNGLRLTDYDAVLAGAEAGPVLVAGDPENSKIVGRLRGQIEPQMPLDGPPFLEEESIQAIAAWIAAGMPRGEGVALAAPERREIPPGGDVFFADVEPIFRKRCIECHSDNSKLGAPPEGLRLDELAHVLAGGERLVVLPGNPEMSEIWRRVVGLGQPRMPFDGPPWLSEYDIRLVHDWIAQGARDDQGQRAAVPVGARVRLRGVLTARDAIDGARFKLDGGTRIDKSPTVGRQAEMRGVVQADGSVRATRLRAR